MHKSSVLLATLCCLSVSAFAEPPHDAHATPAPEAHSAPQFAAPLHHETQPLPTHIISNDSPSIPAQPEAPAVKPQQPEAPAVKPQQPEVPMHHTAATPPPSPAQTAQQPSPAATNTPAQTAQQPSPAATNTPAQSTQQNTASTPEAHKKTDPSWVKTLKDLFN